MTVFRVIYVKVKSYRLLYRHLPRLSQRNLYSISALNQVGLIELQPDSIFQLIFLEFVLNLAQKHCRFIPHWKMRCNFRYWISSHFFPLHSVDLPGIYFSLCTSLNSANSLEICFLLQFFATAEDFSLTTSWFHFQLCFGSTWNLPKKSPLFSTFREFDYIKTLWYIYIILCSISCM